MRRVGCFYWIAATNPTPRFLPALLFLQLTTPHSPTGAFLDPTPPTTTATHHNTHPLCPTPVIHPPVHFSPLLLLTVLYAVQSDTPPHRMFVSPPIVCPTRRTASTCFLPLPLDPAELPSPHHRTPTPRTGRCHHVIRRLHHARAKGCLSQRGFRPATQNLAQLVQPDTKGALRAALLGARSSVLGPRSSVLGAAWAALLGAAVG